MTFTKHNPPTVQSFRTAGFKTSVRHLRPVLAGDWKEYISYLPAKAADRLLRSRFADIGHIRNAMQQDLIYPRGGETIITLEKNGQTYEAHSRCSSRDIFCRSFGINRCLWQLYGQLLKNNNGQIP